MSDHEEIKGGSKLTDRSRIEDSRLSSKRKRSRLTTTSGQVGAALPLTMMRVLVSP